MFYHVIFLVYLQPHFDFAFGQWSGALNRTALWKDDHRWEAFQKSLQLIFVKFISDKMVTLYANEILKKRAYIGPYLQSLISSNNCVFIWTLSTAKFKNNWIYVIFFIFKSFWNVRFVNRNNTFTPLSNLHIFDSSIEWYKVVNWIGGEPGLDRSKPNHKAE